DVPYYLFHSKEELSLVIPSGRVLDESMAERLDLFDKFIHERTEGHNLTEEERIVLAYMIKSEEANREGKYTIALTPDNNHFGAIQRLEQCGLLVNHPKGDEYHRIYLAAREFVVRDESKELSTMFGLMYTTLDPFIQEILQVVCIAAKFKRDGGLNAKQVYRVLRPRMIDEVRRLGEDEFYRKVRHRVQKLGPPKSDLKPDEWLAERGFMLKVIGPKHRPVYALNSEAFKK
ncbi:MAG: hypothetical protein WAT74_12590, partial [Flavobacteriales bacterium]